MEHDAKGEIAGVVTPYIEEHQTGYGLAFTVEAYKLEDNLHTVELILLSKNSRVMEPMVFEFFAENGRPGITLVSDDQ